MDDSLTMAYPGDQSGMEGGAVSLQMQAAGYGSGGVGGTFDATGLPDGLSIDPNTGLISGTIAAGAADGGPYFVSVRYTNAAGDDAGTNFTWLVSDPVTLSDPGAQSVTEGAAVSLPIPGADADYSSLSYAATDLPPGLTIDPTTGLISGTVAAGDATAGDDAAGTYIATVMAVDGGGSFAAQTVEWDVAPAVTFTDPGDQAGTEGAAVALPIQGVDAAGAPLSYSAAGLPAGLGIDPSTGRISGTIAAGAAAGGPYQVVVTASDGAYSGSLAFVWTVAAGPLSMTDPERQSGVEGQQVALQVQANDSDGAALLYTATGLPDGLILNPTSGLISGTIAAGDAANGPYFVTVTAWGADGCSAGQSFGWDVASPVTITALADQSGAEGDAVNLQVQGADQYGGALSYSATGLPAGLGISGAGLISGTIAAGAAAGGPYLVTVTATDGTYQGSQTFTWQVAAPAAADSPPYQPTPDTQDDGPTDWSARDQALASFAEPGPDGFGDAAAAPAEQDAVFGDLVERPGDGVGLILLAAGGFGGHSNGYAPPPRRRSGPSPSDLWMAGVWAALPQVTDPNALQWARDQGLILKEADNLGFIQHSWSEWIVGPDGKTHLLVSAASSLSVPEAAKYMALEIENDYKNAGSPAVKLGGDLADVARVRALQKQAAEEEATLAHRPVALIDQLVKDGLAYLQPSGRADHDQDYVYIATVAGDSVVMLVYRYTTYYLPGPELTFGPNGMKKITDYKLVKAWHEPLNGHPVLNGAALLAHEQTPEEAKEFIKGAQSQEAADSAQAFAEMVTFVYHMLPFGAAWDSLAHGDPWEATLSLLGDVAFFAGGPWAKFAGEGTVLAKGLTITAIAADATLGAVRGEQAYFAFQAGHNEQAMGYLGEAFLRLLGASLTAVSELGAAAGGKAVHNADELFTEATCAANDIRGCFAAGTPVLTPDGAKCIEQFRPGDRVLSRAESDPDGPVTAKVVEAAVARTARVLHLHVGGEVIRTSAEHPFWVHGRGWLPASRLGVGDLLVSHDGQVKLVEDVLDTGEHETVYNVRVADFHTYFVGGDAWGFSVWAHNNECVPVKWRDEFAALPDEGPNGVSAKDRYLTYLKDKAEEGRPAVSPSAWWKEVQAGATGVANLASKEVLNQRLNNLLGELGISKKDNEVFAFGTSSKALLADDALQHSGAGDLFMATDMDVVKAFGLRNVAKAGGGELAGGVLVIKRSVWKWLEDQGLVVVKEIDDMPGKMEIVFKPGAAEVINERGKWIRLPPDFFKE